MRKLPFVYFQSEKFKKTIMLFLCCLNIFCLLLPLTTSCQTKQYSKITYLYLKVTDLFDNPLQNVAITIKEDDNTLKTDTNGMVFLEVSVCHTDINADSNWFGKTLIAKAEGFVPTIVFNFVLYDDKVRHATLRLFEDDKTLPYCAYVEIPLKPDILLLLN